MLFLLFLYYVVLCFHAQILAICYIDVFSACLLFDLFLFFMFTLKQDRTYKSKLNFINFVQQDIRACHVKWERMLSTMHVYNAH